MARTANPDLIERRRRAILDAAFVCFSRQGFHQTSMAAICAEAELSAGALYRYFPSKSDIIAAIAEEDRHTVAAILEGALTSGRLVDDLVEMALTLTDRFQAETAGTLLADVLGEASRDPALGARLLAVDADTRACLVSAITRAQARGEICPGTDPEAAARLLFSTLDGLCLRLSLPGSGEPQTLIADFKFLIERLLLPLLARAANDIAETTP